MHVFLNTKITDFVIDFMSMNFIDFNFSANLELYMFHSSWCTTQSMINVNTNFLFIALKKRLHIKLRRKKALRATKKVLNPNKSSFLPNLYVFGFDLLLIAFFLCNFFRTLCDQHSLWNGFQKKSCQFWWKKETWIVIPKLLC